jgi:hypothetical protein
MARRLRPGLVMILFTVASVLAAQSNERIDAILEETPATVASAAYVALSAAGLIADSTSPERAVAVAAEAGWLDADVDPDAPVSFGRFAYLLMEATRIKGGLMYRIIPGPRYAAREFVYREWSPERRAPGDEITGQFLIRVTGNFLDSAEVSR